MDNFQSLAAVYVRLDGEVKILRALTENVYGSLAVLTVIFTLIMGFAGYLFKKKTETEIEDDVNKHIGALDTSVKKEYEDKFNELSKLYKDAIDRLDLANIEDCRLHAYLADNRKAHYLSAIWYLRVVNSYLKLGIEDSARDYLENFKQSVLKLDNGQKEIFENIVDKDEIISMLDGEHWKNNEMLDDVKKHIKIGVIVGTDAAK